MAAAGGGLILQGIWTETGRIVGLLRLVWADGRDILQPGESVLILAANTKGIAAMQAIHTLTVQLPEPLYREVQARARRLHRSVEGEVVALLTTALPTLDNLPGALVDEMAQLVFLSDRDLWRAARNKLTSEENEHMQELLSKRQRIGLTRQEEEEVDGLLLRYERSMLLRAQSMALLKERGHDVSDLLPAPISQ